MKFISPMLAASVKDLSKTTYENGFRLEVKHDGMRAIFTKTDGVVKVFSRTEKEYTEHIPELVKEFNETFPDNTILDGELMVVSEYLDLKGNRTPVPDFNKTMRIMGSKPEKALKEQETTKIKFLVFDILELGGTDLKETPYKERVELLKTMFSGVPSTGTLLHLEYVEPWAEWDETDLKLLVDNKIEGAILKHEDSVYLPGKRRPKLWAKYKIELTADVVVTGFTEAKEGVSGKFLGLIGAIKFGAYNDAGELVEVGQCSGMTDEVRRYWTDIWDNVDITERVIEIKYNDVLATGAPRHPQYRGERVDKNPEDCLLTQFEG